MERRIKRSGPNQQDVNRGGEYEEQKTYGVYYCSRGIGPGLGGDCCFRLCGENTPKGKAYGWHGERGHSVQLGPRPYFLVEDMDESGLKAELQQCSEGPFRRTDFWIGHRGAAMQFPEHTQESCVAAARMGAGILECDLTFTFDMELVCRHFQCDLHTTTNILAIPELAAGCSEPFVPAVFDADGRLDALASAKCCTSDIALDEFKMLCGKMDANDPNATTVEEYMGGTANYRSDLYATCGTVLSHAESIELFRDLGVKMTPELKAPSVEMPYEGHYTQENYAQQVIDEYNDAGVCPKKVFAQSFNLDDMRYWIEKEPCFGMQAVCLDGRYNDPAFDHTKPRTWTPNMKELVAEGLNIIAPPMWMLLKLNKNGKIKPSTDVRLAKAAGLDIITWTLERSGPLNTGGGWYYPTITDAIDSDGDMF